MAYKKKTPVKTKKEKVAEAARIKQENAICNVIYRTVTDANDAWERYRELNSPAKRFIHYVGFTYKGEEFKVYVICRNKMEAYTLIMTEFFSAYVQNLTRSAYGDPRPKLEHDIEILHTQLSEARSFLEMILGNDSDDPRYQELKKNVTEKIIDKENSLTVKQKYLNELSKMTTAEATAYHLEHGSKVGRDTKLLNTQAIQESVYPPPERPPVTESELDEDV